MTTSHSSPPWAKVRDPVGIVDHLFGLCLATVYVLFHVRTARTLGYARDEGFYFNAAQSYGRWFELLAQNFHLATERGTVDAYWNANHEHPALVKSIFALSWTLFYKKWHLFTEEGTSFRFGGMLFAGGALWLLYIWGARARSRTAGFFAAALFALMPRVYYQSHLDCFDIPIVTMWTLCAYMYWRSLDKGSVAFALCTGVVFGLSLETKHNSWFLPFALVFHALLMRGTRLLSDLRTGTLRIPLALPAMALLGPVIFVLLWPWLWFDTAARFNGYVQFHMNHDYYNMVFLGETYWKPPMPRGYAWLMTAATVPAITLLLFFIGVSTRTRSAIRLFFGRQRHRHAGPLEPHDPARTDLLWLICLAVQYAPWLSNKTPIFGGTKHWMTAYSFLCLFAGVGVDVVSRHIRNWIRTRLQSSALARGSDFLVGACILSAPLVETAHSHPWGLSNYTPLVGGASGAATLGLNRQFWGFTTGAVVPFLNQHVPPGGSVYVHDTAWDSWEMLHRDGRLLPTVQGSGSPAQATFSLYHHEEHMEGVEYQIWQAYGTSAPVYVGAYDGVPIVYVYARPGSMR